MANYSPNYNLYLPSRNDSDVEVDTSLTTNFTNIDNGLANHDAQLADIMPIDVKQYGAKGDGTTDDTTAIQNAINDAVSKNTSGNGLSIYFPKGIYQFTSVSLATNLQANIGYQNIRFYGDGVLKNGTLKIGQDGANYDYVKYNVTIEGLKFWADTLGTTNAIELRRAYNIRILGCNFRKYNAGVAVPSISLGGTNQVGSGRIIIDRCSVGDYGNGDNQECNYLFYVGANTTGGAMSCGDTTITNCSPLLCHNAVLQVTGQDGLLFNDNYCNVNNYASTEPMINVISGTEIVIADNHIFPPANSAYTKSAIFLNNIIHATVSGNNINAGVNWGGHGISIVGSVAQTAVWSSITGNTIFVPQGNGINVSSVKGLIISGNTVESAGGWGISVDANSDTILALDNLLANCTSGTIQMLGTNCSYADTRVGTTLFNQSLFVNNTVSATQFRYAGDTTRIMLWGTGSPNGNVTAGVGSIYLDASGSTGTTFYVKESGTGTNTGWVAK